MAFRTDFYCFLGLVCDMVFVNIISEFVLIAHIAFDTFINVSYRLSPAISSAVPTEIIFWMDYIIAGSALVY